MLKGCGHDIGGYRDVHWNFYCDAIQRLKKTPTEQVERPRCALVPRRRMLFDFAARPPPGGWGMRVIGVWRGHHF